MNSKIMASLKKAPIYLTSWVAISTTALFSTVFASDATTASIENRSVQAQGLPLLAQADVSVETPMLEDVAVEAPAESVDSEDTASSDVELEELTPEVEVEAVAEEEVDAEEAIVSDEVAVDSEEDITEVLDVEEGGLLDEIEDSAADVDDLLEETALEETVEENVVDNMDASAEAVSEEKPSDVAASDMEETYSKLYQSLRAFIAQDSGEVVSEEAIKAVASDVAQLEEVVQVEEEQSSDDEMQTQESAEEDILAVLAEEGAEVAVNEEDLEAVGDVLDVLEEITEELVVAEEEPQDLLEVFAENAVPDNAVEEVASVADDSAEDLVADVTDVENVLADVEEDIFDEEVAAAVVNTEENNVEKVTEVVEEPVKKVEAVVAPAVTPVAAVEEVQPAKAMPKVVPTTPVVEVKKQEEKVVVQSPASIPKVVKKVAVAPVESAKIDAVVEKAAKAAPNVIEKVAQHVQDELNKPMRPASRYGIDRTRELFQDNVSEAVDEEEGELIVAKPPESIRDKVDIKVSHRKKSQKPINIEQKIATAYRAMVSGQIEAAINVYKQILEVQHKNKTALFGLATAYHRNNQLQQARSIYLEILQLYPKHQEAMNNFMLLVAKEDPNKALNELKKIEELNPHYSPVLAQIGMVYLQMENLAQAKAYLARAVKITPNNASYLYNYAVILDSIGEKKQAVAFYQRLLKEVDRGAVISGSVEKVVRRLKFLKRKLSHGS